MEAKTTQAIRMNAASAPSGQEKRIGAFARYFGIPALGVTLIAVGGCAGLKNLKNAIGLGDTEKPAVVKAEGKKAAKEAAKTEDLSKVCADYCAKQEEGGELKDLQDKKNRFKTFPNYFTSKEKTAALTELAETKEGVAAITSLLRDAKLSQEGKWAISAILKKPASKAAFIDFLKQHESMVVTEKDPVGAYLKQFEAPAKAAKQVKETKQTKTQKK